MDWLDVDTDRLRQLQADAEEAIQLRAANARLEKMLELDAEGTIAALQCQHWFRTCYRAVVERHIVDIPIHYHTPLEALEAAFVEWEKGEDGG